MKTRYHSDIEVDYLEAEKEVWKTIFRDAKPTRFRYIYKTIKALSSSKLAPHITTQRLILSPFGTMTNGFKQ